MEVIALPDANITLHYSASEFEATCHCIKLVEESNFQTRKIHLCKNSLFSLFGPFPFRHYFCTVLLLLQVIRLFFEYRAASPPWPNEERCCPFPMPAHFFRTMELPILPEVVAERRNFEGRDRVRGAEVNGGGGGWRVCTPSPPTRRVCNFGVEVWGVQKYKGPPCDCSQKRQFFEFTQDRMRF
jgi:hypothetical protein